MKTKVKLCGLLFGVFLFSYLAFIFLSDKGSPNSITAPASAQDRTSAVLERAQQAQEDIFILAKADPSKKETPKEEEKPAVDDPAGVFPVYGNHWGKEEIPELRDFSKWANEYAKSPQRTKEQLEQGVELAQARREIMRILIELDPEVALASAVPRDVLVQLPKQVQSHLAQRVSGVGTLTVMGVTPQPGAKSTHSLVVREGEINGVTYQANVYGQMRSLGYTEEIYLHGVALGNQVALADTPVRLLEVGEPLAQGVPIEAKHPVNQSIANQKRGRVLGPFFVEDQKGYHCLCCSDLAWGEYNSARLGSDGRIAAAAVGRAYNNTGAKKWLLIPVAFPDNTQSPWSSTSVRDSRISETQDFYNTSSFGVFTLSTADVVPLQTMDNNSSYYVTEGYQTLKTHALDKATAAGYSSDDYDFASIVINHYLYTFGGRGQLGNKINWINGSSWRPNGQDMGVGVYIHELGHNLGLWHANSWISNTSVADDSNGTHDEYGHLFDVMGDANLPATPKHFNASFKNAMDWLPDSYVTTLTDSDADTSINLYGMDQTQVSGRAYAVKLDTGVSLGSNTDLDYWVEFRTRYPANSTLDDGVLIYTSNDTHTDEALKLLDMTPSTSSFDDAGLDMSESFSIAGGRWKITVNSQTGSGADSYVNVSFEDARSPVITTQPADTSAKYGTSVTLSVSATGPSLSYQWHKDGTALAGETNSTLAISDFQEANKDDYHVVVTNDYGTATSSTATLSESTGRRECGSMPPVNLVVIGWFGLLFSRLFLWFNFGVPRTSPVIPKTKKKPLENQTHILLLAGVLLFLGSSGCTSIEARAKGAQKPFPGIRYLKDSRHSMYGDEGVLVTQHQEEPTEDQTGCFWDEAGEAMLYSSPAFMDDEVVQALCLICYWPVDFAATLGLDTALLPFDALDKHAQDKKAAEE